LPFIGCKILKEENMKTFKILTILSILAFSFSATLRAEWFDGEVQKIDAKAKTITISEIDPITETEEKTEVLIDGATVFSGVKSLKDIRENDNVTIEAQYDEPTDAWKALSVEVAEAGA
jgi:hypothetical protein